jgi:hypothetical protein
VPKISSCNVHRRAFISTGERRKYASLQKLILTSRECRISSFKKKTGIRRCLAEYYKKIIFKNYQVNFSLPILLIGWKIIQKRYINRR